MNNQLVLQFRGAALETFARLEGFEAGVTGRLAAGEMFDGVDAGTHGANVFLYTDEPEAAFQRIRPILKDVESLEGFTVAVRQVSREGFRVLWPRDSTTTFALR